MCQLVSKIESFPSLQKSFTPQQSGVMIPLYSNLTDPFFAVKYIYAGTVFSRALKGPYLHTKRSGNLILLEGEILLVHQNGNSFCEDYLIPFTQIQLPVNTGYCIIGLGKETSTFINICNYAWQPGDQETIVPDFSNYDFKKWGIK